MPLSGGSTICGNAFWAVPGAMGVYLHLGCNARPISGLRLAAQGQPTLTVCCFMEISFNQVGNGASAGHYLFWDEVPDRPQPCLSQRLGL